MQDTFDGESGDVVTALASTLSGAIDGRDSLVASITGLGYQGITFNVANGARADNPFGKDKRVRAALDLALDRNVLNEVANNGAFKVGNQPQPPGTYYYNQELAVPGRDVTRAKALLKEAGVASPTLTLLVPNADADRQAADPVLPVARRIEALWASSFFERSADLYGNVQMFRGALLGSSTSQ